MDARLLDILVCPICKGPLVHRKAQAELICKADRLGFPIRQARAHRGSRIGQAVPGIRPA
ncbi:MAG: Trm112 family protein [Betaproteobacteria bacterium]|nr:MAG: Trm112 family protein [Betaproteobacteria bacterium]